MTTKYEYISNLDSKYVFQNYTRQPLALIRGKGAVVWDTQGKEYIDCVAGIAVNSIGHCHPYVIEAVNHQVSELIHISNLYYNQKQPELAEKLVRLTKMDRAFFCNSGAEAVEGALKLARKATGRTDFVAAENGFHGRTMGALSTTHKQQFRAPFEPLIKNVDFVPYNDTEALKAVVKKSTAAVILEPIQGEGGINIPDNKYLQAARDICDESRALLIFDEIQTGFGRTGRWFACEHSNVRPDIMTLGKAIASGLPMGAVLAKEQIASKMQKGEHGTTFGGGPLLCAAALAVIKVIEDEDLVAKSANMGDYLTDKLKRIGSDNIKEIRSRGLMIGIELALKCAPVVEYARANGVLLNCTSDYVLRLVPPLVITAKQIDRVTEVIEKGIQEAK